MAKAAVRDVPAQRPVRAARPGQEPVWLVRLAILLFLVGFAAFLAREVANFLRTV